MTSSGKAQKPNSQGQPHNVQMKECFIVVEPQSDPNLPFYNDQSLDAFFFAQNSGSNTGEGNSINNPEVTDLQNNSSPQNDQRQMVSTQPPKLLLAIHLEEFTLNEKTIITIVHRSSFKKCKFAEMVQLLKTLIKKHHKLTGKIFECFLGKNMKQNLLFFLLPRLADYLIVNSNKNLFIEHAQTIKQSQKKFQKKHYEKRNQPDVKGAINALQACRCHISQCTRVLHRRSSQKLSIQRFNDFLTKTLCIHQLQEIQNCLTSNGSEKRYQFKFWKELLQKQFLMITRLTEHFSKDNEQQGNDKTIQFIISFKEMTLQQLTSQNEPNQAQTIQHKKSFTNPHGLLEWFSPKKTDNSIKIASKVQIKQIRKVQQQIITQQQIETHHRDYEALQQQHIENIMKQQSDEISIDAASNLAIYSNNDTITLQKVPKYCDISLDPNSLSWEKQFLNLKFEYSSNSVIERQSISEEDQQIDGKGKRLSPGTSKIYQSISADGQNHFELNSDDVQSFSKKRIHYNDHQNTNINIVMTYKESNI